MDSSYLKQELPSKQVTYGKGWEDEQQGVRNYWMALRKGGTGI